METNKEIKELVKKVINEGRWDLDWNDYSSLDKWKNLERDLHNCIKPLIEKYKKDFGNDSYGVIDAIYQVMDNMFQKK
jgi:hypothetical protein